MAGIGFELRKMIDQREGFVAKVRAYTCAGLISSGPWLMTILTLSLMSMAAPHADESHEFGMFRALVTYAFAFSLVMTGIVQMSATRRIADLLYGKKYDLVLPGFTASVLVMALVQGFIGTAFCLFAGFSPAMSFVSVSLYIIVSLTWLALVWLSVTREYDEVLRAYGYGTLTSLMLLLAVGGTGEALNMLAAYTGGQALTLILLIRTIVRGMAAGGPRDFSLFGSLKAFPRLVAIGLLYNLAIWVDKMIFWFGDGIGPHPWLQYHPLYDTCSFLAYLTVIPALAINLVRLETSFYERYRSYYGAILGEMPLRIIEEKRKEMLEDLRDSTVRLLRVQGFITVGCLIFAPFVLEWLAMPDVAVRIFRLSCIGAFFHVLLLITILMQLYFDLRWQALSTSVVFLALNAFLAGWSVAGGVSTYGIGYAISTFLSLLLGYTLLSRSLERLHFLTFTGQPIGSDEDRMEAELEGRSDEDDGLPPPMPADDGDEDDDGGEPEEQEGEGQPADGPEPPSGVGEPEKGPAVVREEDEDAPAEPFTDKGITETELA